MEHHEFSFDDVLDERVSNDAVYRSTVQPLVATIFRAGKVCSISKFTCTFEGLLLCDLTSTYICPP